MSTETLQAARRADHRNSTLGATADLTAEARAARRRVRCSPFPSGRGAALRSSQINPQLICTRWCAQMRQASMSMDASSSSNSQGASKTSVGVRDSPKPRHTLLDCDAARSPLAGALNQRAPVRSPHGDSWVDAQTCVACPAFPDQRARAFSSSVRLVTPACAQRSSRTSCTAYRSPSRTDRTPFSSSSGDGGVSWCVAPTTAGASSSS